MIHYRPTRSQPPTSRSVFLDTDRSVDKACSVIEEAAGNGERLIAFPETFLPGFPIWAASKRRSGRMSSSRRSPPPPSRSTGPSWHASADGTTKRDLRLDRLH